MIVVDQENIQKYIESICDVNQPIAERVDSLFCLRSFQEIEAIDGLILAFHTEKKSELLLHEICYVMGQMDNSPAHVAKIVQFLEMIIDGDHPQIVIHEAVEALANMSNYDSLGLLKKFEAVDSPHTEVVRETVELARDLLIWKKETEEGKSEGIDLTKMRIKTNDPAPPFNYWQLEEYKSIENLTSILLDN
jgi:hypothetical protein